MAAAVATSPARFSSLSKALEPRSFHESQELYNSLRDDSEQPPVHDNHLKDLANLFVRHNAHNHFGIHLIHGHFAIPKGTVLVGSDFEEPRGRWTKLTDINQIDPSKVHGHIFVVGRGGDLCAYEYQESPLPDLSGVGDNFLEDFVNYVMGHNLNGLIGLQVLGVNNDYPMSELILDHGTVMLETAVVKGCSATRTTGWSFQEVNGSPRVCQNNEKHSKMTSGNHKVFDVGKRRPKKLENVEDLKLALAEAGVL